MNRATAPEVLRERTTFADVRRASLSGIGTGPLVLLCVMRAWGGITNYWSVGGLDPGSAVQTPPGGWHAALGCTRRAVVKWRRELLAARLIDDLHGQPSRQTHVYGLRETAETVREGGDWCRVHTRPLVDPDLPMTAKRAWLALSSFAGTDLECFPSMTAIARRMERARRNAQRAVSALRRAGYVRVNQRRGSSLYALNPKGDPPPRGARIAPPNSPEVHESPPRSEQIALPPRTDRPPGVNESPPLEVHGSPPILGEWNTKDDDERSSTKDRNGAPRQNNGATPPAFPGRTEGATDTIDENDPEVQKRRRQAAEIAARERA